MIDGSPVSLETGDSIEYAWTPASSDLHLLATSHPHMKWVLFCEAVAGGRAIVRISDFSLWDGVVHEPRPSSIKTNPHWWSRLISKKEQCK